MPFSVCAPCGVLQLRASFFRRFPLDRSDRPRSDGSGGPRSVSRAKRGAWPSFCVLGLSGCLPCMWRTHTPASGREAQPARRFHLRALTPIPMELGSSEAPRPHGETDRKPHGKQERNTSRQVTPTDRQAARQVGAPRLSCRLVSSSLRLSVCRVFQFPFLPRSICESVRGDSHCLARRGAVSWLRALDMDLAVACPGSFCFPHLCATNARRASWPGHVATRPRQPRPLTWTCVPPIRRLPLASEIHPAGGAWRCVACAARRCNQGTQVESAAARGHGVSTSARHRCWRWICPV